MRIDVGDIKLETGSHKTVPVSIAMEAVEIAGQSVQFDRPFTGEAEIWNAGDRLLVRANLAGDALLECSRCLTRYSTPLEISFEEEFIEGGPQARNDDDEEEVELAEERTVTYYNGDELDLSESLRDNVLLELPMKPLCKEECEGLWSEVEQEPEQAEKAEDHVDPRLAVLKNLIKKPDSNS